MMNEVSVWSFGKMIVAEENENTCKKPVPLPLCPLQIAHALSWCCTQVSAVKRLLLVV